MSEAVNKSVVINQNRAHDKDTGSPEVQVALFSARINHLTEHLKLHPKDFASRRGLIMMTNKRRRLLRFLKSLDVKRYDALIQKLKIRG